jgi:hypothetical protein
LRLEPQIRPVVLVIDNEVSIAANACRGGNLAVVRELEWQIQPEALKWYPRTPVPVTHIPLRSQGSSLE